MADPQELQTTTNRRLAALYAADHILASSQSVRDAAPRILRALGESEGWMLGNLWLVDENAKVLRLAGSWTQAGHDYAAYMVPTQERIFPIGYGVPGRVWQSGEPIWTADIAEEEAFLQRDLAVSAGLRSAFVFPLWSLEKVIGVIELYSEKHLPPDEAQIQMMMSFSQQLGQFIEYKRAEVALRRSYAVVSAQQEAAIDGILVVDENRNVLSFNQRFLDLWGVPRELMLSSDDERLLAHVKPLLADSERFFARREYLYEHPLARSEDEIELVDGRVLARYSAPAVSAEGEYFGRVWFYRDISERKRFEESTARLAAIVESTSDAIVGKNLEGIITTWNRGAERMYGYTAAEAIGRSVSLIFPPEDIDELNLIMSRIKAGDHIENCETVRMRKDGERVDVSVSISPIKDGQGRVIGAASIARDITEIKRMRERLQAQFEQLKELDRLKNIFVNAVTHELKTPLTSMKGFLEFLEDGLGGPLTDKELEFIHEIHRGEERIERLVTDLLDFARLEAGTFKLSCETADLTAKIREIAASLAPQIAAARISLVLDLPDEPLELAMDSARVGQVLINLVNNACKFTPEGGTITIRACAEAHDVRCEVSDTGIGIAPDDLPKLFKRFAQLEEGARRGGTGLGLNISKAFVEAHGGHIGVTSTPGHGSTFWFTLPREEAALDTSMPGPVEIMRREQPQHLRGEAS